MSPPPCNTMTDIVVPKTLNLVGTEATEAPCPLFQIPGELRNAIYRFVFEDSKVALHRPYSSVESVVRTMGFYPRISKRGRPGDFESNSQWQILLTCRLIFQEALPLFYEETGFLPGDHFMYGLEDFADAASYNSITRLNHLRDVYPSYPGICDLGTALARFPSLKSCSFKPQVRNRVTNSDWDWICEKDELVPERVCDGAPGEFLRDRNLSHLATRIQFVRRFTLENIRRHPDPQPGRQWLYSYKVVFINYSTGKSYVTDDKGIGDETGYRRILV